DRGSEPVKARRVAAFVESLRRNRRPRPFEPGPDDVEAMRAAIELNNAQPGAALPSGEFVNDLHRRLAEELDETGAPVDLAARVSRRRMLGGIGAAAAAAAVGGVVLDRAVLDSGSSPAAAPKAQDLVPDEGVWQPVLKA